MTVRKRSRIWTQQPQVPARPSKLIRDAVACAPMVGLESVAKQLVVGAPNQSTIPWGVGTSFISGQYVTVDHGYKGTDYTLIALGDFTHSGAARQVINNDDVGSNRIFQLRVIDYAVDFIPFDAGGSNGYLAVSSAGFATAAKTRTRAIVARAGGGKIALDVTDCGSASGTIASHKAMVGMTMIGNMVGNITIGNSDKTLAYAIVPRYMSDAEVKRILDNPWQIFARRSSRRLISSVGGSSTSLTVQDAQHGHLADSPVFSMATYLAVAESLHSHAADNLALTTTGTANLVVQEATHTHTADGVVLTTQWLLAIAEALHSHAADNVALTLQTALSVLEALHGHSADSLTLGITGSTNLVIADATSGHAADNLAFSLNTLLAVFNAIHAHAADNLTLDTSNATALTVQDSTHGHGADNLNLSLDTWLAIVGATHAHTADSPTLSSSTALLLAKALHVHYADTLVLGFPSAPGSSPTVDEIVSAVLAALNATTIPVDVRKVLTVPVTGDWPTANDNADALLARTWP